VRLSNFLLEDLRALFADFGQTNGHRLFAAFHYASLSTLSRAQFS
jgi:hypothetical protein